MKKRQLLILILPITSIVIYVYYIKSANLNLNEIKNDSTTSAPDNFLLNASKQIQLLQIHCKKTKIRFEDIEKLNSHVSLF